MLDFLNREVIKLSDDFLVLETEDRFSRHKIKKLNTLKHIRTMKKIIMSLTILLLVSTTISGRPVKSKQNRIENENQTELIALAYQLNAEQKAQLQHLHRGWQGKRHQILAQYKQRIEKAGEKKRVKLEKKMQEALDMAQAIYHQRLERIMTKEQYQQYCIDFQLKQSILFQELARLNHSTI